MKVESPVERILASFEKQRDEMNAAKPGMGDAIMGGYIEQAKASIKEAEDRREDFANAEKWAKLKGIPAPRHCTKCAGCMEWDRQIDDNLGNDRPQGWSCECGHFIEDETQHFDQE